MTSCGYNNCEFYTIDYDNKCLDCKDGNKYKYNEIKKEEIAEMMKDLDRG